MRHPVVWAVPAGVLLALVLMPVNDGFYIGFVNYDPQGDEQQWEWRYVTEVMRRTSGVLAGHMLALVAGALIGRRHRLPVALGVAAATGMALGSAVMVTAWAAGGERLRAGTDGRVLWEPAVLESPPYWALLLAFPLYALLGAGLSRLLPRRPGVVVTILLVAAWLVVTAAGLSQDDEGSIPVTLLWLVPPLAAATAIASAGRSLDVWPPYPTTPAGDWGEQAAIALAGGLTVYLVAVTAATRWKRRRPPPARG
ncbi:hypothetical protein [Actinoplanes flavus]|uniref:Uncharacterized protein n=1 Tax=Actinoplanes flavus TaxID=2820290 RepID=A0ABS3UJN4_9ACTN|nr:hypothetical protein [Actinoplanes flavus]MBO3737973.1 hypothetical protein [Actinoplanes flavus]